MWGQRKPVLGEKNCKTQKKRMFSWILYANWKLNWITMWTDSESCQPTHRPGIRQTVFWCPIFSKKPCSFQNNWDISCWLYDKTKSSNVSKQFFQFDYSDVILSPFLPPWQPFPFCTLLYWYTDQYNNIFSMLIYTTPYCNLADISTYNPVSFYYLPSTAGV